MADYKGFVCPIWPTLRGSSVPHGRLYEAFYFGFLGLHRDPAPGAFHANLGAQQFHLNIGPVAQVRGSAGGLGSGSAGSDGRRADAAGSASCVPGSVVFLSNKPSSVSVVASLSVFLARGSPLTRLRTE